MVGDQNVLWLEIPVIDAQRVAMLDSIEDLEEDLLGQLVVANILSALRDIQEEVALGAIFKNDEDAVRVVHDLEHRDHIAVRGGLVVETDFPLLILYLAPLQWGPVRVELA
jgi:hypothetical protein